MPAFQVKAIDTLGAGDVFHGLFALGLAEGISEEDDLNYIQKAFIDNDGTQCGYCAPGFIISTYFLLKNNHSPSDDDIKNAISGNLCRCNSYHTILNSIKSASKQRPNE